VLDPFSVFWWNVENRLKRELSLFGVCNFKLCEAMTLAVACDGWIIPSLKWRRCWETDWLKTIWYQYFLCNCTVKLLIFLLNAITSHMCVVLMYYYYYTDRHWWHSVLQSKYCRIRQTRPLTKYIIRLEETKGGKLYCPRGAGLL
jgi:hypothetical protein